MFRLIQPFFNDIKNARCNHIDDEIDNGFKEVGFREFEGRSGNGFCLEHQFGNGDDHQNGRVLDVDNQFITDGREGIADSLRKDHHDHGLCVGKTERSCGFCLSFIDCLNTGTDDFCHVGTCIDRDDDHGGGQLIPMEYIQKGIVEEGGLYHHRSTTEYRDIDIGKNVEYLFQYFGNRTGCVIKLCSFEPSDKQSEK